MGGRREYFLVSARVSVTAVARRLLIAWFLDSIVVWWFSCLSELSALVVAVDQVSQPLPIFNRSKLHLPQLAMHIATVSRLQRIVF